MNTAAAIIKLRPETGAYPKTAAAMNRQGGGKVMTADPDIGCPQNGIGNIKEET